MVMPHSASVLLGLLILSFGASCTYTVAGDTPPPLEPSPPAFQPTVEHTVAEFSFALGGGDMSTSIFDGRMLGNEIMESWLERGYVRGQQYVADGEFSGTADYRLTLRGSQRGDTSFTMQVINALTLSLVPYTVTQHYDLQYVLEDAKTGAHYTATVQASDKTWVEPFLILTFPFAGRGHLTTMQRVGDSFYDQFHRQGAFTNGPG